MRDCSAKLNGRELCGRVPIPIMMTAGVASPNIRGELRSMFYSIIPYKLYQYQHNSNSLTVQLCSADFVSLGTDFSKTCCCFVCLPLLYIIVLHH